MFSHLRNIFSTSFLFTASPKSQCWLKKPLLTVIKYGSFDQRLVVTQVKIDWQKVENCIMLQGQVADSGHMVTDTCFKTPILDEDTQWHFKYWTHRKYQRSWSFYVQLLAYTYNVVRWSPHKPALLTWASTLIKCCVFTWLIVWPVTFYLWLLTSPVFCNIIPYNAWKSL